MKSQKFIFFLYQIGIAGLLGFNGCVSPTTNSYQASKIPSLIIASTVTPASTQKPIAFSFSTPTMIPPVPTQLPEQTKLMRELLHSKDCSLPCYLGIVPGKTSLSEGEAILKSIGAKYHSSYKREKDKTTEYAYDLWIGVPSEINVTPEPNGDWNIIIHAISFISTNEIVQNIEVIAAVTKLKEEYRSYWSIYSVKEILRRYGIPEQMYFNHIDHEMAYLGRSILLIYRKLGVVVEVYGNQDENNICIEPGYEANSLSLRLSLYDPNSGVDIYADGRVPPSDPDVWVPIEEELGMDAAEFYRRVIDNPSVCFKPNIKKP